MLRFRPCFAIAFTICSLQVPDHECLAAGKAQEIRIPAGTAVSVDGIESRGEWDDAARITILVSRDWEVPVRFKHDSENLYFVFENVVAGKQRLFPEILLDPQYRKSWAWQEGQWWLHVSNNLCEGNGEANVYVRGGIFQCAHQKDGWAGNNPPGSNTKTIEVSVSFRKLGIRPERGSRIGIAFDMTNATGDERQQWFFWPPQAKLLAPVSWGSAVLE
jgi:hypothetical protein